MRYYNNKYKKICATCKKLNANKNEESFNCPLDELFSKLKNKELKEDEFEEILFSHACDEHENFFFETKKVEEVVFDEFEYNVEKDNMSPYVRVCNPFDTERRTFLGFNLGFMPVSPELESSELNKLYIKNSFDLGFYLPELNIIVFNSESIWFPVDKIGENFSLKQITEEEVEFFEENKENIIELFYPDLFKETKENELFKFDSSVS